ncbi:MAG: hypothetical protein ASARMPRED_005907 [Alectoria sarmentosa]|nr:MAG: hypothetical protein ASARMPRED_005907 [Alectoria sarmentosa]
MKFSKPMRPAWRIIQDSATNFLRAFGLHLIVSAFRSLRHLAIGKGYDEPTKIAIRKSRTTALMRALVHIVPVSVALWEIIFNWNTYYMGAVIRNQAYYQFGAKVHEMTAQASLAAIVFSYVRYEMSLGRGLPFGALFSGLQISQASYLWSMEFWGSICSKHLPVRRRVASSYQSAYDYTPAPANVQAIGAGSLRQLAFANQSPIYSGPGYDPVTVAATTQQAAVADALSTTGVLWNLALENVTTKGHGSVLDQLDAVHSITTGYYQPYTLASCAHDTIFGYEDQNPVAFPIPPGSIEQMLNTSNFNDSILSYQNHNMILPSHGFIYPEISRSQILDTSGHPGEYRLRWIELPEDPFNGTAIGAVVLLPRASENTTQEVLMCNLAAGWGTSKMNMSTFDGGSDTVLSEVGLTPAGISLGAKIVEQTAPLTEEIAAVNQGYVVLPLFPQRLIAVNADWAQYLNPSLSDSNTTVFNRLMASRLLIPDISVSARIVLTGLLANGLARIGSTSQLQGTVKTAVQPDGSESLNGDYWFSGKGDIFIVDPVESEDWVKLRVYSTMEGFAYNTTGATTKVAICFLLTYCIFALAHILYAGITGISSTCWDSIGEVTALAVNSTPSALLRNTCSGITELDIFKIPVRVLALRDKENIDGEHLELVFGNLDEKSIQNQVIKTNRFYGTMPVFALEKEKDE